MAGPPGGIAAGGVAVLVGGTGGLRSAIASGLAAQGHTVVPAAGFASRAAADAAFAAASRTGRIRVVVHAATEPAALEPSPLLEHDDADWDRRCEAPIRAALYTLQAAYPRLAPDGGRVVLVCPAPPAAGGAGQVPLAAAAQAIQALARSAAHRWAALRIAVNLVTVAPAAFADAGNGEVAALVGFLAGSGASRAAGLTGLTIAAEAGSGAGPWAS